MAAEPLTEDALRQLLRECVTVVKPGETLILRTDLSPQQVEHYQEALNYWLADLGSPFRALVVHADELGIAEAGAES